MVVVEPYDGESAFQCEVCGFHYRDQETAARCEAYCKEHDACNAVLAQKALERI